MRKNQYTNRLMRSRLSSRRSESVSSNYITGYIDKAVFLNHLNIYSIFIYSHDQCIWYRKIILTVLWICEYRVTVHDLRKIIVEC